MGKELNTSSEATPLGVETAWKVCSSLKKTKQNNQKTLWVQEQVTTTLRTSRGKSQARPQANLQTSQLGHADF